MESKEQSAKNQIISDLRAGRISRGLVGLILGDGGYRLTRNQLDVIFEWMVSNPDEWRVVATPDNRGFVVVFGTSPFHPEFWDDIDMYKNVMRQMFGDFGTPDFLNHRCSMAEAGIITKGLKELQAPIEVNDYVVFNYEGAETLGMIINRNAYKSEFMVRMLSGVKRGMFYLCDGTELTAVSPESAIKELVRQKKEWKNKKSEEAVAKQHEEFRNRYGNIVRGSYLKNGKALYIVKSVDVDSAKATAIRLVDLGINFPANEKCVLPLANGFKIATPEEVAEILVKEYCNE